MARAHNLHDLVDLGTLDARAAAFLRASIIAGLNLVVCDARTPAQLTLLNCLAAAIPGGERVISCEEVFELRFSHPD